MNATQYEKLSLAASAEFPSEWYSPAHGCHFWFRARFGALKALLAEHAVPLEDPLLAIDVGCGMGVVRAQVEDLTRWTVDGADLNEVAARYCQR